LTARADGTCPTIKWRDIWEDDLDSNSIYWSKTKTLMIVSLAIWAIFGFGVHLFAPALNEIVVLGFPLGFYMAAQGSLIVFVVLIFWFARRQDAIDRECGVAETD
jgi:putative solute:sodium symporter small subunit